MKDVNAIAAERRLDILETVYHAKAGHIGGSMSCIDILVTLYYEILDVQGIRDQSPGRDRFVLSKGHCAEALYTVLADLGFFPKEELQTFAAYGTRLAEHPTRKIPGVELATGALGHGLSAGLGMALGLRRGGYDGRVFVLMGDGELAEGSVWEAVMAAAKFAPGHLTAIVDRNRLQISGGTEDVMPLDDLAAKFAAFGWRVKACDGHDHRALADALSAAHPAAPLVVIADTVKGKGSALMENQADWHHLIPNAEQYEAIKADLLRAKEVRS